MLKRINESLPGLVAGILIYGVIVQLTGVWFVEDKWAYSIGLWYGIAIAIGMGINMAVVIYDTVTFYDGEHTNRRVAAKSILRYFVVVILFFILGYFEIGNLFTAFVGAMGLKFSAYMQPLLTKLVNKLLGRDDAASYDENFPNENSEIINEEVTM
ncbi:MAG: hypothetical protein IJ419_09325 [Agathobacter sp.]|nr:hypothetical protein [Agathobacter sp.]